MLFPRAVRRSMVAAIIALVVSASGAFADPPGRVARISFIAGSVSFRPGSLDEWSSADLNHPLTIGDHLWVESRSRTELQLGSAVVRLGSSSEFSVLNLDDRVVQLRLTQGSLALRVRTLDQDEVVEIDTPNGALSLARPGFYRVDVNDGGDQTTVTVRAGGEAEIAADGPAVSIPNGQTVVWSGLDAPVSGMLAASAGDEFDDWCLARDRHAESAGSVRYVSRDMIGYEDLDDHGTWQVVADYGPVWLPRVRAEWAPYRYGHWSWVEPWGWTWIDDAPWGFAPFHYGRWVRLQAGWGWMPGTIVARPVYAPALVGFVGGSSWRGSLTVGAEPVAWFPLGPREAFVPGYRVSPAYTRRVNVTQVNVTNVNINVTNVRYVNRDVAGAVTAVPHDVFVHGRGVGAVGVAVPRESVRSAPVVATAAVAPQPASLAGQAVARAAAPPPSTATRPVVVRSTPPPSPVPFAARRAAFAANPGKPVDDDALKSLRAQAPPASQQPLVRPARPASGRPAVRPNQNQTTTPAPNPPAPAPPPAGQSPPQAQPPTAAPRPTPPDTPATVPARGQRPAPQAAPAPPSPTPAPKPAPPPPASPPAPASAPPPAPAPAAAPKPSAPAQALPRANEAPAAAQERAARAAALNERHAHEAADVQARQTAERAQLQARHQQEEQHATEPHAKQQVRQRHQEEMKALQERHRAELEALRSRQQEARKQQAK